MKKSGYVPVASIHTHFNLLRNVNDAKQGPVTIDEQVAAIERFVRWHERQVEVGKALLAQLRAQQEKPAEAESVPA